MTFTDLSNQNGLGPMMRQYVAAKRAAGDSLLLFRMGDFYEAFCEDAVTLSEKAGITLTRFRDSVPMAGAPAWGIETKVAMLIKQGIPVALCDPIGHAPGDIERASDGARLADEGEWRK